MVDRIIPTIEHNYQANDGIPQDVGQTITFTIGDLGDSEIDYVKVVHDFGKSIDFKIDLGQAEGGIVQGIGWVTLEEIRYSEIGKDWYW